MNVDVNVESIRETRIKMLDKISTILNNIEVVGEKVSESEKIYDTPTATKIRDSANEYIYSSKKYIDNVLMPFIENLDTIADIYEETYNKISDQVN